MKISRYKLALSFALLAGCFNGLFAKENVGHRTPTPPSAGAKTAEFCAVTTAQTDLDINGVRARVLVGGDLWWDPVGKTPFYEIPQGTGKTAIYAGALWIGGIDKTGQLLVAAQTYRQEGANEFWGGPITKDINTGALGITSDRCNEFDRFWGVTRKEVADFAAGGEATKAIKEWPGNGRAAEGELPNLAPFFDADGNGEYNYSGGDYPYFLLQGDYAIDPVSNSPVCNDYLFGDKSIWWVFNDVGNVKTESNSDPIGLEVRAQAFAFKTSDQVNFMTFYKYQVINRSNDSLNQSYFGVWVDPDLGNAADDYVGCDVGLGLGYVYNGDPDDEGGDGYGLNPPALGVDFFQGPLADAGDGIDNDKDGTTDEPGEQIIMSNFMYYVNLNNLPNGNPAVTDDYYQYLSSYWCDGQKVTFGEGGRNPANPPTNYMFSNGTDPAFASSWSMVSANIQPDDMRWLQSAGTFTLAPGAVNYITTGVVWGRATAGGPLASVTLMKLADQKAQALFDNCFKILDGPDAPDLAIRELDSKIILNLENTSNEKVELYNAVDPIIPKQVPNSTGGFTDLSTAERSYKFQGYRIYQVVSSSVTEADLNDISKAKLYRQIDINDSITQIVNFAFDNTLNAWVPQEVASGSENKGLQHSFEITTDLFQQKPLVNFTTYYYLVVSYAYNNFRPFDEDNSSFTQARPFVQGRNNVKVYSAIPHKPIVENGGTQFNTTYGAGVEIKRIEGSGNGGNVLELTSGTINEILTSPDHRAQYPIYQPGHGPISVSVYDPMAVKAGNFKLAFSGLSNSDFWYLYNNPSASYSIANISYSTLSVDRDSVLIETTSPVPVEAGQFITLNGIQGGLVMPPNVNESFQVASVSGNYILILTPKGVSGGYTPGTGTVTPALVRGSVSLNYINNQLYEPNKIAISASKINGQEPGNPGAPNNGLLESSITFANPDRPWLTGVPDKDNATVSPPRTDPRDWILSGVLTNTSLDYTSGGFLDSTSAYEEIIGGTWAPMILVNYKSVGAAKKNDPTVQSFQRFSTLHSVDIVFTKNRDLWTRSVVIELGEDTMPNIGGAKKFQKRNQPSIDKSGRPFGDPNADATEAGLTDNVGMGWFPGYAINVETGERLNIVYGENSSLTASNSQDMQWNPTSNIGKDAGTGRLSFGGMHYIYILNRDTVPGQMEQYDEGVKANALIKLYTSSSLRTFFREVSWVSMPLIDDRYGFMDNDAKVRIRVRKNYRSFVSANTTAIDSGKPRYEFNIPGSFEPSRNVSSKGSDALDLIQVVPNPYYAYSRYEQTITDQLDNRVRIINLPSKCTVSIYTLSGTLVRQFRRDVASNTSEGEAVVKGRDDNLATSLDWDIKNTAGIKVASGIYIIHVDAGQLGEKIVKWFGIMRPIDLNSF